MKTATTLIFLALGLAPGLAMADCRGDKPDQTAASCMPGTTWDTTKGTCIENPSS